MTRLHGRAPVGERLVARIPHGHCQTSTLIAGVRTSGPCAPWVFEGAMDGELIRRVRAVWWAVDPSTRL